ncbi:MAG: RNA-binding protein [Nitrospiraceae bacterium]
MASTLYVKGFPSIVTQQDLAALFGTFGTVNVVLMPRTEDGQSMGIAEVIMAKEQEAFRATKALHRVNVYGNLLFVRGEEAITTAEERHDNRHESADTGS